MSIPPPNTFNPYASWTSDHTQHYTSDPYGAPSSGGAYGGGNPYQAYEQQLRQYITQMQMLYNQTMDGNTKMQIQQNLNLAFQYLQQIGADLGMGANPMNPMMGGDPNMNPFGNQTADPFGMGLGPDGGQSLAYPVDFQDSSHVVSETGEEIHYVLDGSDPETRPVDFYQPEVTITVPLNASQVKVTSETDENGKPVYIFKITLKNGKTIERRFHDPKHISVEASKPEYVILDASMGALAKNVKVHEIGYKDDFKGTMYDEETGDTFVWNTNDSVDYYATEGEEINEFYCDTLNYTVMSRDNTVEVTRTGEHEYTIVEKDKDGNIVRTSKGYQIDMINFKGVDAENFFYQDSTSSDSAGLKAFSDNEHDPDAQITVGGVSGAEGEGEALNPEYKDEDTIPDDVKGKDAYYKSLDSSGVTIHNYEDDKVDTHHITTVEEVNLYATDADQLVEITDNGDGSYTIKMGKETYIVDGPPSKINIHALPKNVKYNGVAYIMGVDDRITVTGEEAAASDLVENMPENYKNLFEAAKGLNPDLTDADFIQAMNEAGLTQADLDAVPPSEKVIAFLRKIDPDLDKLLNDKGLLTHVNDQAHIDARRKVVDHLAALLGPLTGKAVEARHSNHPEQRWRTYLSTADDMAIGGVIYDIFDTAGKLRFEQYAMNPEKHGLPEVDPVTGAATGISSWYVGGQLSTITTDELNGDDADGDLENDTVDDVTSTDIQKANANKVDYD